MAQVGIEGFDHHVFGDATPFDAVNGSTMFTTTSRFGAGNGQGWRASSGQNRLHWDIGSNQTKVIQGAAYLFRTGNNGELFEIYDGATIQVWCIADATNHRIQAYRGAGTTNLLGSSANNTTPPGDNEWAYVEWEVVLNNTTGSVKVWIDDLLVLNLTNIDTCATANEFATRGTAVIRQNWGIDDYYFFDGSGAQCNARVGPCRVYTGYPTSDASVQFTPLSGVTNWAMVDEVADIDNDTTYNVSATAGHQDFFGTNQSVPGGSTVVCCESRSTIRKDDVGARTGRALSKSNATVTNGTTINLPTTYTQQRIRHELDPDTGVAWTVAGANALQPGYECVT